MQTAGAPTDPRAIITPDAFEVSNELLGLPLAPPSKRLAALLVDLVVIGALTAVTRSFGVVLGVVAAALFIRAGFKRTPVRGSVWGRAMRLSVGCLGVFVAVVTAIVWASLGIDVGRSGDADDNLPEDLEERAAVEVAAALERAGLAGVDVPGLQEPPAASGADTAVLPPEAADTVRTLERRIGRLELENARREIEVRALRDVVEEGARRRGLFDRLRELVDELGFGFGWASLYMTVLLSMWSGRTVGKRLMGIRVLRLDGEPITWWLAFERAGGYAAGFATGLLGFAQVYWDANRQAIHDRIAGTVVVIDGAERIGNWDAALR